MTVLNAPANTEIERKFLVKGDFLGDVYAVSHIAQGYLSKEPGRTIRARVLDDKGYICVKIAGSVISHFEWEKEISVEEARLLMQHCQAGLIDKDRHYAHNTDGVHTWEIDVFHGDNEGLVVAEIELASEDETFDRPEWLGEEVSADRRYYNSALVLNPYKNWIK